jgi:predicted transcriptional regulator
LARTGELSPTEIGAELGIHRATVYKYLNAPDSLIKDVSEIYDQHRTYRALVAKRERAKRALTAPLTKALQPGNRTHGSKTKANKGRAAASGSRRRKAAAGSGQGRTRV